MKTPKRSALIESWPVRGTSHHAHVSRRLVESKSAMLSGESIICQSCAVGRSEISERYSNSMTEIINIKLMYIAPAIAKTSPLRASSPCPGIRQRHRAANIVAPPSAPASSAYSDMTRHSRRLIIVTTRQALPRHLPSVA